jgi:nitrous oxidase accessory protein NosD
MHKAGRIQMIARWVCRLRRSLVPTLATACILAAGGAAAAVDFSHGHVLRVGPGQGFQTLAAALGAAKDGDTIQVQAGTYVNDYAIITHSVHIVGVGGKPHFVSRGNIPNDKAILIDQAPELVLENLEFSGAEVPDQNGAGVRHEKGILIVKNCDFHDNQDAILGGRVQGGQVLIEGSSFDHNGAGDGQSHGVYIGEVDSLTVRDSYFHNTVMGSHLKSRAAHSDIEANRFIDGPRATTNYDIDLCNGGFAIVKDNIIEKSADADNRALIHFGGEIKDPVGSLLVQNNTLTSARSNSTAVMNQTKLPVSFVHNTVGAKIAAIFDGNPGSERETAKVAR